MIIHTYSLECVRMEPYPSGYYIQIYNILSNYKLKDGKQVKQIITRE